MKTAELPLVPLEIKLRPFAVEPETGIMLPDGIFESSLGRLEIKFHISNDTEETFHNVYYELETYSPQDFTILKRKGTILKIEPGAVVIAEFEANFIGSVPGEKKMKIWLSGDNIRFKGRYIDKKIFVTRTTLNNVSGEYKCETPGGTMLLNLHQVAISENYPYCHPDYKGPAPKLFIPLTGKIILIPSKPIVDKFDAIPFEDPLALWKALAFLIAALAAIAAYIAAKNGRGTASIGIVYSQTPTGNTICKPYLPNLGKDEGVTLATVLSAIASAALAAGLKHYRDPWLIGRENIKLRTGENITSEEVTFKIDPEFPIEAGKKYKVHAEWKYLARLNTGSTFLLEKTEDTFNEDVIENALVMAPTEVHGLNLIKVGLKVLKSVNPEVLYPLNETYAYCLLVSPSPDRIAFKIELQDSSNKYYDRVGDGWLTGGLHLEELGLRRDQIFGEWTAYFFAQVINATPEGASIDESTKYVGGNLMVSPQTINPTPDLSCPMDNIGAILKYVKKILVN